MRSRDSNSGFQQQDTRQVEIMQRELFEEREQKQQLELIEGDLVHKLQVLEGDNTQLRYQVRD